GPYSYWRCSEFAARPKAAESGIASDMVETSGAMLARSKHESTGTPAWAVFHPKPTATGPSGYAKFLLSTGISYFDWTRAFGESKVSKKEN
ncbi:MAG: hypothetical protein WAL45_13535, partial [Terracidiphilus sp.]